MIILIFYAIFSGLTRVRRFQQDDAHIFCRVDQIRDEVRLSFHVHLAILARVLVSSRCVPFYSTLPRFALCRNRFVVRIAAGGWRAGLHELVLHHLRLHVRAEPVHSTQEGAGLEGAVGPGGGHDEGGPGHVWQAVEDQPWRRRLLWPQGTPVEMFTSL